MLSVAQPITMLPSRCLKKLSVAPDDLSKPGSEGQELKIIKPDGFFQLPKQQKIRISSRTAVQL
jgi:hypothetical protein